MEKYLLGNNWEIQRGRGETKEKILQNDESFKSTVTLVNKMYLLWRQGQIT